MPDSGQNAEFTLLYRKYADLVYGIALSCLKNPAEAEDAAADVFMQILESGITFPDDIRARAWLVKAAQNRCKNLLKHWLRKKRASEEVMEQLPADDLTPELHDVMNAMLALPEKYRLPLMLFAVQGYSVHETAEMLQMNESTVRTRIARARAMIRKETGVNNA